MRGCKLAAGRKTTGQFVQRSREVLCTNHGQLGLQLNFQGLQSAFQFCDLILGGTGRPSISRDLCLQ